MASLRRPTRIVVRGHDEREYAFLVKGGEDLRQDQRVCQLLQVMNGVLARDAACGQRGLQVTTYRVVPMTSRCAEPPVGDGGAGGTGPEGVLSGRGGGGPVTVRVLGVTGQRPTAQTLLSP